MNTSEIMIYFTHVVKEQFKDETIYQKCIQPKIIHIKLLNHLFNTYSIEA